MSEVGSDMVPYMKVLYIHQYFATPDSPHGTRSYEFARRLVSKGHEVTMLTSMTNLQEADKQLGEWRASVQGIDIIAINVDYSQSMGYPRRVVAFLAFALKAAWASRYLSPDVVFATSTPLTVAIPAAEAARKHSVPFVLEIRDLWPEIPIAVGALRDPISKWLATTLEKWAYNRADRIVALSPGIADGVRRRVDSEVIVHIIPNGCDVEAFRVSSSIRQQVREELGLDPDHKVVFYAGAFGKANQVDYLLDVASHAWVLDRSVRFVLLGRGSEYPRLKAKAGSSGLLATNTMMFNPVPKAEIPRFFAAADLVTSLFAPMPELESTSPNKVFDGLAAGKPIALNHSGWLSTQLVSAGAGIALSRNPADAAQDLVEHLRDRDWMRRAGIASAGLASSVFDRDLQAEELELLLSDVLASQLSPGER